MTRWTEVITFLPTQTYLSNSPIIRDSSIGDGRLHDTTCLQQQFKHRMTAWDSETRCNAGGISDVEYNFTSNQLGGE